ncbi:LAETG motif-containing sortase-dependent surface protein [Streptomyces sp. NPDC037389]|uniref:LAETG motif-containing sortase-dependent surface protein n=1 Tax=Streptomyces sp. NPDC037389 TaxID=3155369 RepID=UPI0033ED2DE1
MQISRIATIVAAGVITPALFLATPAVAEELPATAGQTTGQTTVEQPGTNPAPKADIADKGGTTEFRNPVKVEGLKPLQAGSGKWLVFDMSFDNKSDKDAAFVPYVSYIPEKPDMNKAEDYALELEYRTGSNGEWLSTRNSLKPTHSVDGTSFSINGLLGKDDKPLMVEKGSKASFELRLRFGKQTPAHDAYFRVTDRTLDSPKTPAWSQQKFSVKAAKVTPEPSKSATTSASPSATESGKATASPKPSTSASASASASASPSASSSSSAAGAASGSGSGSYSGGTSATGSRTELAATGSDPATPWIAAGGAVAIVAGAGLVVATRRRAGARG